MVLISFYNMAIVIRSKEMETLFLRAGFLTGVENMRGEEGRLFKS